MMVVFLDFTFSESSFSSSSLSVSSSSSIGCSRWSWCFECWFWAPITVFKRIDKKWTFSFEMNFPATNGAHQAVLLSQALSAKLAILLQGWIFNRRKDKNTDHSAVLIWSQIPNCFHLFFFGKKQNKGPPESPLQPVDPSEPTVRKHPSAEGMFGRSVSFSK